MGIIVLHVFASLPSQAAARGGLDPSPARAPFPNSSASHSQFVGSGFVLPENQDRNYIYDMLAFPLLELERMAKAEIAARKGLAINKNDFWSHHNVPLPKCTDGPITRTSQPTRFRCVARRAKKKRQQAVPGYSSSSPWGVPPPAPLTTNNPKPPNGLRGGDTSIFSTSLPVLRMKNDENNELVTSEEFRRLL